MKMLSGVRCGVIGRKIYGIKVMTMTLGTRQSADGISFACDKDVIMSVTKYELQM